MNIPFKVDLNEKVVVITGAGGVLCSEMAHALALCGAKVVIATRSLNSAQPVVDSIIEKKGTAMPVLFDVLDEKAICAARDEILQKWGRIDILINGAGGNSPHATTTMEYCTEETLLNKKDSEVSFFDLNFEDMVNVMNLNFFGTLLPSQIFGKIMAEKGCGNIINISSMSAYTPLTKVPLYSASKAAVSNFTQWLSVHFAPIGIRVNGIAPGFFETHQNKKLLRNENGSLTPRAEKILKSTPMNKFGVPADLIGALLYLASDEASSFVTGTIIPIDGGFSAYSGV
ncbi:MAG: SDR family oxidoreductase [Treponemataceae bacterium]